MTGFINNTIAMRCWEKWVVVGGLSCVCIFLWSNAASVSSMAFWQSNGPGRIDVTPAEVNFYRDKGNAQGVVNITLRNSGSATVNLLSITASCGCTVPKTMPSREIKPGDSTVVTVEVTPPGYGRRTSVVTIETDSVESPKIQVPLHLHGMKLNPPFISFAPPSVQIDSIVGSHTRSMSFRVTCVESPGELWLKGFKSSLSNVELALPRLIKEQVLDEATVQREYSSEVKVSTAEANLSFWISPITRTEAKRSHSPILVNVSQVEAIRAVPSAIVLSSSEQKGDEILRHIALISADNEKWDIISMETDASWLKAEKLTQESVARHRRITVSGFPSELPANSPLQTDLRVRTTHPKCPEVRVRITAVPVMISDLQQKP